jgi:alkanesulfonate monooxygenase SsuD/methylene tetrahydromethanopterin reductase-like flavin-dependent oxidoreductase (luciferase family)
LADRTARSLVDGGNRLKLGLFGTNCNNGLSLTMAETGYKATWEHTLAIAQRADRMGFEMLVPIARWRGFDGAGDPFGESFETMAWAAGLASKTERIVPVGTLHVSLMHPVFAAKQCVTIDHLSGGRFALNAVMGWSRQDMQMFGIELLEHDERYRYGSEWLEIVRKVWAEPEEFDFDGEYFQLKAVRGMPKPLQHPYPVILNAGNSAAGMDFAAREADFNFAVTDNLETASTLITKARDHARERYGREHLPLLGTGFMICRDSEEEAVAVAERMIAQGDHEAGRNSLAEFGIGSDSLSAEFQAALDQWVLRMGAYKLIGTPTQIAEGLASLVEVGLDGMMLGALDYYQELGTFNEKVMPLLVEMGLRDQVHPLED